jgi:hypothetical protein
LGLGILGLGVSLVLGFYFKTKEAENRSRKELAASLEVHRLLKRLTKHHIA